MRYTTSTFIIFRANARVKTRQRLNDRVLDDVAYDIDSEMIVPLFMDEVDISGVDWVVELQPQEVKFGLSEKHTQFEKIFLMGWRFT